METARVRHDQWLQSAPDQCASIEPAYILGDHKLTPEAVNAVDNVLWTELLDAIPKTLADACMRHGYCTAEQIIWYIVKQLILPLDVSEVTMQKEILTPPKTPLSTLDQASKWLEETHHRLNLRIKTKQNVHPRTLVAFVIEMLSAVIQCYRTIGNIWDALYNKHQLRDSGSLTIAWVGWHSHPCMALEIWGSYSANASTTACRLILENASAISHCKLAMPCTSVCRLTTWAKWMHPSGVPNACCLARRSCLGC